MRPGPHVKPGGAAIDGCINRLEYVLLLLSAVGGGEDKIVSDKASPAEPHVVNEERHDPGPLVLLRLVPAHNSRPGPGVVAVILNTADVWIDNSKSWKSL